MIIEYRRSSDSRLECSWIVDSENFNVPRVGEFVVFGSGEIDFEVKRVRYFADRADISREFRRWKLIEVYLADAPTNDT